MRLNLVVIGGGGNQQKWEDALLEIESPKAKQFDRRLRNELNMLMKLAFGTQLLNFRYIELIKKRKCPYNTLIFPRDLLRHI